MPLCSHHGHFVSLEEKKSECSFSSWGRIILASALSFDESNVTHVNVSFPNALRELFVLDRMVARLLAPLKDGLQTFQLLGLLVRLHVSLQRC